MHRLPIIVSKHRGSQTRFASTVEFHTARGLSDRLELSSPAIAGVGLYLSSFFITISSQVRHLFT
jgi:hypothetical protein